MGHNHDSVCVAALPDSAFLQCCCPKYSCYSSPVCVGRREWNLYFKRTPVEFVADEATGRVAGVQMEINELQVSTSGCSELYDC